jgi:hypothetical protein
MDAGGEHGGVDECHIGGRVSTWLHRRGMIWP